MKYLKKAKDFVIRVVVLSTKKVIDFVKGCFRHAEAITILVLSSLGVNALLSEIPFYLTLPMWVEITMVIPVISVILIMILTRSATWRAERRENFAVA